MGRNNSIFENFADSIVELGFGLFGGDGSRIKGELEFVEERGQFG